MAYKQARDAFTNKGNEDQAVQVDAARADAWAAAGTAYEILTGILKADGYGKRATEIYPTAAQAWGRAGNNSRGAELHEKAAGIWAAAGRTNKASHQYDQAAIYWSRADEPGRKASALEMGATIRQPVDDITAIMYGQAGDAWTAAGDDGRAAAAFEKAAEASEAHN